MRKLHSILGAGDWRGAVTAYRSANMWEDALRVAKKASGEKAAQQVGIYLYNLKSVLFFIFLLLISSSDFLLGCLNVGPNIGSGTRCETSDATKLLGTLPAIGMRSQLV